MDEKNGSWNSGPGQSSGSVPQTDFAPQSKAVPQAAYPPAVPVTFDPYNYVFKDTSAPQNQHVPNANEEEPIVKGFQFSTASIRRGFIRKVYAILSLQLSVTLAFVLLCIHNDGVGLYVRNSVPTVVCAIALAFATIICISCCEGVRRTSPTNIIFLSLFTIAESYMVGFTTTMYDPQIVWLAILFTTVVVVSLTIFAMQTKWDFTKLNGTLFVAIWIFVLMGFIMSFMKQTDTMVMIFCSIGAILFSVYLIHDTQLIMGDGDRELQLSPEEYVLGAITLFLDIINIFLYILRILGAASKN